MQNKEDDMRQNNLQSVFDTLPPDAQKQVLDFISFLETRYKSGSLRKGRRARLRKEPFVGMWSRREDMKDSAAWVRNVRRSEWGK